MADAPNLDALRKRVTTARRAYLDRCRAGEGGWDAVVLTAANERQARGYRLQMAERERAGLWPRHRRWRVVPDPGGRRIGSGLATLNAVRALRAEGLDPMRSLVLHCGGSSVRMPHASAFGKVFMPLPAPLTDDRPTTVLDENLAMLEPEADPPPGLTVAAGDVLLVLGDGPVDADAVTVFTVPAPAEAGEGHGVFLADRADGAVQRILQKAPVDILRREGATDAQDRVLIDTGVFRLPATLVATLEAVLADRTSMLAHAMAEGVEIDLYTDIAEALAAHTDHAAYLRAVDYPRDECRETLWALLHDVWPLRVSRRRPGAFYHVGGTRALIEALRPASEPARVLGFVRSIGSGDIAAEGAAFIDCTGTTPSAQPGAVAERCVLSAGCALGEDSLACRLGAEGPFELPAGLAAFTVPLRFQDGARATATAVYGVDDNPKRRIGEGATFLNASFAAWIDTHNIQPDDLWPHDAPHTLWHARLFPVAAGDSENGDRPSTEKGTGTFSCRKMSQSPFPALQVDAWRAARRVSLAQMFELADCEQLVAGADGNDKEST